MADLHAENAFVAARSQAKIALDSHWWESLKATGRTLGAWIVASGVTAAMVSAEMINTGQAWAVVLAGSASLPITFMAFELQRLHGRSQALSALFRAQLDYESRLNEMRDERDRYRNEAIELKHFSSALQTTLLMSANKSVAGDRDRE